MIIHTVNFINFRGFKDTTFNFENGVNIIIGANASGKTGLLEGLAVALGSFFIGITDKESRRIRPKDIRIEWVTDSFENQYPVEVYASGTVLGEKISWMRALNSERGNTTTKEAKSIKDIAVHADEKVRSGMPINLPLLAYYGNGRLYLEPNDKIKLGDKKKLSRLNGYELALDPRCSPRELNRWMFKQEMDHFKQKQEPLLYAIVKKAITGAVEGCLAVDFDAQREEIVLVFKDDKKLPFSYLSDGQRSIAAMLGDLAMRAAVLNPHLEDRVLEVVEGVVLIDEVELYLHPRWQRRILVCLEKTFPKVQFICTTHSPQVLSELDHKNIINLEKMGPQVVSTYGLDSNTILEEEMGTSSRPHLIKIQFEKVKDLIAAEQLDEAKSALIELSSQITRSDPEIAELESVIGNMKAFLGE